MTLTDSPDARVLLEHASFVRRLARSLVKDENLAEDLSQQTMLEALRRSPRGAASRGWFAAVVRNLARRQVRSNSRQSRREQALAPAPPAPSAAEQSARHELLREVVNAVLDLREPLRSTLFQRFFEDLPPREIARREGLSVSTVNSRIQRALREVRGRMDAGRGGDRRAWCLVLIGVLQSSGKEAATLASGAFAKATVAAAIVLAVGWTAYRSIGGSVDASRGVSKAPPPIDAPAATPPSGGPLPVATLREVVQMPAPAEAAGAAEDPAPAWAEGLVTIEGSGLAVTAGTVLVRFLAPGSEDADMDSVEVDPAGRFALELSAGCVLVSMEVKASTAGKPVAHFLDHQEILAPLALQPGEHREYALAVREGKILSGLALASDGSPLRGARVYREPRCGSDGGQEATTDAQGRFRLAGLGEAHEEVRASLVLLVPGRPLFRKVVVLPFGVDRSPEIVLQLPASVTLRGILTHLGERSPQGWEIVALTESPTRHAGEPRRIRTLERAFPEADGRFELCIPPEPEVELQLRRLSQVIASRKGLDATRDRTDLEIPVPALCDVEVIAVDPEGRPLAPKDWTLFAATGGSFAPIQSMSRLGSHFDAPVGERVQLLGVQGQWNPVLATELLVGELTLEVRPSQPPVTLPLYPFRPPQLPDDKTFRVTASSACTWFRIRFERPAGEPARGVSFHRAVGGWSVGVPARERIHFGLPPGPQEVRVFHRDCEDFILRLDGRPFEIQDITIHLEP